MSDEESDIVVTRPCPELAILDVINALRSVVVFLHSNGQWSTGAHALSTTDSTTLLNLLADAEAKLQLP